MAPIRAYYLPTDSASDIDASHPVSVQQINALGWKISSVAGGRDEIEQAGQKIAQELGFPITQNGCIVPFNFDVEKNTAPEMATLLTKAAENLSDICIANAAVVVVTSGSLYLDVEGEYNLHPTYCTLIDVTAAGWVRIHFGAGTLYCVPAGAKYRVPLTEQNRGGAGIVFFKETIFNQGLLVKKDIDNHPARRAYLNEVLGQT